MKYANILFSQVNQADVMLNNTGDITLIQKIFVIDASSMSCKEFLEERAKYLQGIETDDPANKNSKGDDQTSNKVLSVDIEVSDKLTAVSVHHKESSAQQ